MCLAPVVCVTDVTYAKPTDRVNVEDGGGGGGTTPGGTTPGGTTPSGGGAGGGTDLFLGLRPWYYGLTESDGKTIKTPTEDTLPTFVAQIVLNVVNDLAMIAGFLVTGFIIYGGYLYMFSEGDPGKAAKGKTTIKSATIGAIITALASIIMNTISAILITGGSTSNSYNLPGIQASAMIESMIGWALSLGGIVSAAFIVYGGVSYMTAAGDAGKLAKAKNSIKYALIGLLIVALATVITGFIFNAIEQSI